MNKYLDWLKALPGKVVFVAYPAAYDFMFVYWYLIRFTGESPFFSFGIRYKNICHGNAKKALSRDHQREYAFPLV